jgi:uncharacterized protein (TIGR02186 family)
MRRAILAPTLAAALVLAQAPCAAARAEALVLSLSSDEILIASNFTGADVAVFGAIERDVATVARNADYDVVVTFRGPRGQVVVREKKRWGPFWLNLDQRRYIAIPAYIGVLSNRPLEKIAGPEMLRKLRLGVDALVTPQGQRDKIFDLEEPEFRQAMMRLRREERLFAENPSGASFLSPTIFQASARLPGTAPLGRYDVDVTVLADGVPLAKGSGSFLVRKDDLERRVATAAHERGWLYGLAAVAMSILLGWLATVIFRRD